jgi:hypothetical protein
MRPGNRYARAHGFGRTLGQFIDSKMAVVAIYRRCRHQRELYPANLIERFGEDCPAMPLREHLRCSGCRARLANLHKSARSVRCVASPTTSCAARYLGQCPSHDPERSTADPARKSSHHQAPFVAGLPPSQLQPAPVPYSNFLSSPAQLPRNLIAPSRVQGLPCGSSSSPLFWLGPRPALSL